MTNRRQFIAKAALLTGATLPVLPAWSRRLQNAIHNANEVPPGTLAKDEQFWRTIQKAYTNKSGYINLNNGGIAPAPKVVADVMKQHYDLSNDIPTYNMSRVLGGKREELRKELAALAGCDAEEIAMMRNTSEAMENIIFGLNLQPGDEVVLCKQDYPNIVSAWQQREKREGIKLVWINLTLPSEDKTYLIDSYANLFTARTKAVQLTHVINWIGQLMPVQEIIAVAQQKGIATIVDGAHSFAQYNFTIPQLGCDYFATSLHKWLGAPIGTGMLYVKKDKVSSVWPLMAAGANEENNIRKFEHLGTRPFYIELATRKAIEFLQTIGLERKQARLQYLKNYWMQKVKELPGVQLHTSMLPEFSGAIGMFSVAGTNPNDISDYLLGSHKVHTVGIKWESFSGVRVTPNVYTTLAELDKLVAGVAAFIKKR